MSEDPPQPAESPQFAMTITLVVILFLAVILIADVIGSITVRVDARRPRGRRSYRSRPEANLLLHAAHPVSRGPRPTALPSRQSAGSGLLQSRTGRNCRRQRVRAGTTGLRGATHSRPRRLI